MNFEELHCLPRSHHQDDTTFRIGQHLCWTKKIGENSKAEVEISQRVTWEEKEKEDEPRRSRSSSPEDDQPSRKAAKEDKHLMETQPLSDQKRKLRDAMEKTREKLQKSKEREEEEKRERWRKRKKREKRNKLRKSSPCSLIILMTS